MQAFTATYSPDDNKLRLYASERLDEELYARVRAAGFIWAPKQELFVSPRWTPSREDLLVELAGEIGDEDTSLVERSEERAERFDGYSASRLADARNASDGVKAISDGIPFGQPILVGHHSEKRARKDAEKIGRGMDRAVKMWKTSEYWTYRAAGAIRAAKYKELPKVRARRIKKLESERRGIVRGFTPKHPEQTILQKRWCCPTCKKTSCDHSEAREKVPHVYCGASRGGSWVEVASLAGRKERAQRWLEHYDNRLAYEKAMLGEQGALDLIAPTARPKQPPLLNYKAPDGLTIENRWHRGEFETWRQVDMTKAEYKAIYSERRGTRPINGHRVRIAILRCEGGSLSGSEWVCVFLTDSKEHPRPEEKPPAEPQPRERPVLLGNHTPIRRTETTPEAKEFQALEASLKTGEAVKVVSAPQLFVTPREIAEKMAEYASIEAGDRVLEPSAGTGRLLGAIGCPMLDSEGNGEIVAVEINQDLAEVLRGEFPLTDIRCSDFLQCNGDLGKFDRIIMNPPFVNGSDIKHIRHAQGLLKPGGVLVALCANGPRQKAAFQDEAEHWEDLPTGSFKESGTGVNVALMVLRSEEQEEKPVKSVKASQLVLL